MEVTAARQLLFEPFSQFPFADSASFAHTIGLMLLPFVRRMIDGPVPIHGVVAPPDSAGTGKGLLVQTACVPGPGEVPSTPEVGNGDELRKKLLPVILEDLPIFLFDNVTTELKGGVLASLLTARIGRTASLAVLKFSAAASARRSSLRRTARGAPLKFADVRTGFGWTRTIPNPGAGPASDTFYRAGHLNIARS